MNPQVADLIRLLKSLQVEGAPRLWELPPDVARKASDALFASVFNEGGPAMAETRELQIPGRHGAIRARLYVPLGVATPAPGLLYLHGGGWVICSPDTHDRLTRELAVAIGARVVSLDYGLAPERPYPQGLDDCEDAARWLHAHGGTLGIDPARLAIGGDSAGGNLTAATLLRLRGGPAAFRAAIYIYGAFGIGFDTPSMRAWGDRDLILSRPVMEWFRGLYLGRTGSPDDPFVSPLKGDLHGLPPAVLVVGTLDPLLSDSELFAAALDKAGVPTELHVFEDAPHAFVQMFMLDMAGDAIARIARFARAQLAQTSTR
jgi:acetyl esterase